MAIGSNDWEGLTLANGRYLITAKLGEGGMGFVYRAQDQNIDAEVVIKIPRQAMMDDPEFAGRFTREIRSLVKLSHPHIVKVTDVGACEGTPFAVMQYLPGGSLEDQRTTGSLGHVLPCDPRKVSCWLVAVAQALDYIHGQGYVHRDVKPGNILFDAVGHAFLSDFGVAKVLASSDNAPAASQAAMTGAGLVLGTPEYMAPELIMGEPFDGRVDQYALAVTVYEMLCGRRPFEDGTKTKVLVLHTRKAPPRLTQWCPALPEHLSQTVLKGLSKDPNQRYPRCVDLAKAVVAAAEGAVAPDDRVRLKCPGCGTTGSMPAADFTRLKESRKPATCPACKAPIDISTADRAAPGARPSGTMQFSSPINPGAHNLASEQAPTAGGTTVFSALGGSGGHTSPQGPQSARGGTMALSAAGNQREWAAPIQNKPQAARGGSGTLIERALPQSDEAAATAVFKSLSSAEPEPLKPARQRQPAADGKGIVKQTQLWIALGAGALALLLLVAFMFSQFGSRQETKPIAAETTAKAATVDDDGPSQTPVVPLVPSRAEEPLTKTKELDTTAGPGPKPQSQPVTDENRVTETPPTPATEVAKPNREQSETNDLPRALANLNATVNRKKVEPAPTTFADHRFDLALLEQKPVSAKVTLEKILAAPRSYSNQTVIPTGMYNLAPSHADRPGGLRQWLATERKIGSKKVGGSLELNSSPSKELELEPQLAARFDDLAADQWRDKMAILTLWITKDGACGLVKAEILEKATPYIRKVGYTHKGDIEYETLQVTPQGTRTTRGNKELWEQVGRMNSFATHYRDQVKAYNRLLHDKEQNILSAQMNSMFGDMMRNAAAAELQQRQLQQRLTGPGR